MDPPKQSLSERLSAVFAAIKKSKRERMANRGSSSSKKSSPKTQPVKDPMEIDTLPDLLVFIKATSNPKVLRDVVARFLLNPLLSDNDRELVKKKVFEKIEEEKRKKMELKKAAAEANVPDPSSSSSQHFADDPPLVPPPVSVNAESKGSASTSAPSAPSAPSENTSEPLSSSTQGPQGTYKGSLLEKLKKLDNLGNSGSSNVENSEQNGASGARFDEWVPWPSKKCYGSEENVRSQEQEGAVSNLTNDQLTPAVQQFSTDFSSFQAAASMFQVQPQPGQPTYQVPPPGIISAPALSNHAFAGFATQETSIGGALISSNFPEKDRIPRTPTPSPPPPPRSPDPRKRPGAVVAAISDSGRLVVPGARAFKKPKFVPQFRTEDATHGRSSPPRSTPWTTADLSSDINGARADKLDRMRSESDDAIPNFNPQFRTNDDTRGRSPPLRSSPWNTADLSSNMSAAMTDKLDRMMSESDDAIQLRNYALYYQVSLEEARKMMEREEEEQAASKRRSRKRGRRGRKEKDQRECDDTRDYYDADKQKIVYKKGFEPLPKQKYAKNIDDNEGYGRGPVAPEWMEPRYRAYPSERSVEEGEILDDSFDYGDGLRPRYPEFGPIERPRLDPYDYDRPYEYDRPPRIPSLLDMIGRTPRDSWR